ncbi:MAG: hypothetical protein J0I08_20840 [Rhizobiales bacterium]|nr:hypothetical protein [Hyphomicrobiales bacterium]
MSGEIPTAWDAEAQALHDESGEPLNVTRDRVILRWLINSGDTRPFYSWVLNGHTASSEVILVVAAMTARADSPNALSSELLNAVPYGLKITGKRRGDRSNPEIDIRNYFIGRRVAEQIANGSKYDVACLTVHEILPSMGVNVTLQTVRDAYDERVKKY